MEILDFRLQMLDRFRQSLALTIRKSKFLLTPLLLSFSTPIVISSCSKQNEVYLILEDSTDLKKESAVLINGYKTGDVHNLKLLNNHKTLVTIRLTEDIDIPEDSEFIVVKSNLLGDADININIGNSKTYISTKDTLLGRNEQKPSEIETAIIKVAKNLANITDSLKIIRDSNYTQQH